MTNTNPQLEFVKGAVNVTDELRALRNDKSLLNQQCQQKFNQPPVFWTRCLGYETKVTLPDGTAYVAQAAMHADSQLKAARAALTSINVKR